MEKYLKESAERLEKYLSRLDSADKDDVGASSRGCEDNLAEKIKAIREKRDRLQSYLNELEKNGEEQLSLTDPDSRAMARMTKIGVGYNIQTAVDAKNKLIVEQEVHSKVLDYRLLTKTAKAAKDILGVDSINVVADRGYFIAEDIEACEKAGMTPYVTKPDRDPAKRTGLFPKEAFIYDIDKDIYTCPGGQTLNCNGIGAIREIERRFYRNRGACMNCPLRTQCTKTTHRTITRYSNQAVLDCMEARLKADPAMQDRRRETVEHPFGTIKFWMNQGAFLMRRIDNVRGEFNLTALAYNIRRALTLIGTAGLIKAVTA